MFSPWSFFVRISKWSRRAKVRAVFVVFLLAMYKLIALANKYGQLFYIETFLPKPSLPPQHRAKDGDSGGHDAGDDTARRPRILCLIATSPAYHKTRAVHVAATWAKHCTKAIFLTSEEDSDLPATYVVPDAEGYYDLWKKVARGFELIHDKNIMLTHNYDWVIKADDDSFVIVEYLQKALSSLDPEEPLAAGQKLLTWDKNEIYLNGGAGYVLSRQAVQDLVSKGLRQNQCEENLNLSTAEDVNMSLCLQYLGVKFIDLRDSEGRSLFHIYPPQEQLDPREATRWKHLWLKKMSVDPYFFGFSDLSDEPVSFHYVDAETMYLMYYLIYVVNPHMNSEKSDTRP